MPMPPAASGEVGGVAELAALVRHCAESGAEREVVWLRLSALPPGLDKPHHLRLLREAAQPRRGRPGRRFGLPNGDLVLVSLPGDAEAGHGRRTLAGMLGGAPDDASGGPAEAGALGPVLRPLRLPDEAAAVLAELEGSLGLGAARAAGEVPPPSPPLDPAALAAAERALVNTDVWPLHARRAVRRLPRDGGAPVLLREEVRPLRRAVADRLLGGRDAEAAPALATRLHDALSERLLLSLLRPDWLGTPRPLQLPLSLAALTGSAMLRLDAALPRGLKGLLTLGVDAAEVLRDPAGFRFGRDLVRQRGYRLCLEAAGASALALLPPDRLGVDAVRVPFAPGLPTDPGPLPAIARAGRVEVVLAGADGTAAIAWGWENGISCFQGRATERQRG